MGFYDEIGSVPVGGSGGPKLGPGEGIVQVLGLKEHHGQTGDHFYIAEVKVLSSNNPQNPAGSEAGVVIKLNGKFPKSALADVKALIAACLGYEKADPRALAIGPLEAQGSVLSTPQAPGGPFAGCVVAYKAWEKPNKSTPGSFTKFEWRPVLENGQPKRLPVPARAMPPAQTPAPFGGVPGAPVGGAYVPPPPAAVAPPPPAFPPPGWTPHPQAPGFFYQGQTVISEAQLRAMMAAGQA